MTNTVNTESTDRMSATVESLKDPEKSTVDLDSYKGRPTLAFNKSGLYPFSFGLLKVKIIARHVKALLRFAETDGRSID